MPGVFCMKKYFVNAALCLKLRIFWGCIWWTNVLERLFDIIVDLAEDCKMFFSSENLVAFIS